MAGVRVYQNVVETKYCPKITEEMNIYEKVKFSSASSPNPSGSNMQENVSESSALSSSIGFTNSQSEKLNSQSESLNF